MAIQAISLVRNYLKGFSILPAHYYILVFLGYFVAAKIGLFVFYTFHTSPALIWPPAGIGLAALLLYGHRMWVPVLLAQFFAYLTEGGWQYADISAVLAVAYALQSLLGAFLLRKMKFSLSLNTTKSALLLAGAAFFVTLFEPLVLTGYHFIVHTMDAPILESLLRSWAAGIFSVLVFTSFLITWLSEKRFTYQRSEKLEVAAALAVLIGTTYAVFWTTLPVYTGIVVIFFIPGVLMWFALNMRPHWMTLAVLVFALGGLAGSVFAAPTPTPLSAQLISDEIYIGLLAGLFLVFVAVVEERRNAYYALQDNNAKLDKALAKISAEDRAKTEFIAMLGHELRNPLAPIVSAHEWLQLQPQTPSSVEALNSAQENTKMMQRLLDDLLDTARVSQRKLKLQKEIVRLQDVVAKAIESTANFLQSRHHKLQVTMPAETVWVDGDSVRLRQVVINLLNNAGKYTKTGGNIHIICEMHGQELALSVKDSGMGLDKEMLETIFEPFNQIPDDSGLNTGLGIGLSLSRRLVELHGGTIRAESEGLGRGSAFTVTIPLPDQRGQQLPAPEKKKDSNATRSEILLVDDNRDAARGLKKLLEYQGHAVTSAFTGEEALALAKSHRPEVIFLDIGLPDMSGYDIAKKLRESGWSGLLIAVTGYGQQTDQKSSLDSGFDVHLIKPVSIHDINRLLSHAKKKAVAA